MPSNFAAALAQGARDWRQLEWPKWLFILRTLLAVTAALWISFRLGFSAPSTSMLTVFIVSAPQAGQVLAKSFYRTLGTLAGAAVGVLLIGCVVQERNLFIVLLAGWLGVCTTGAAYFRNFRAYAFVLSGYTAGIIALPALSQPDAVFDIAVLRVSEVMLGILCTGVFADLLLPLRTTSALVQSVRGGYSSFIDYLQKVRDGRLDLADFEDSNLAFVSHAIEFETLREYGYFENPEVRVRSSRLRLYNAEFMNVGTAFYGFYAMLGRRRRAGDAALVAAFSTIGDPLLAALQPGGKPASTAAEARHALRRLRHFRRHLPQRLADARIDVDAASRAAGFEYPSIRFDTVARQFDRFLQALTRYTEAYASLDRLRARSPHRAQRFSPQTEPLGALMMGLRAFLTVLLVASFWIVTAWPAGAGAVLLAGVICALFAASPNPALAARNLLFGFALALPAAILVEFGLLPHLDGFALLLAGLAPFLMASVYLASMPRTASIGLGFNLLFVNLVGVTNTMSFDPVALLNNGIAQILGVFVSLLMLTAIMPAQPNWFGAIMRAQLHRNAMMACRARLGGLRARFESRTRDLLAQSVSRADRSRGEHRAQLSHALAVLDLGDAVIHLRRAARDAGARLPAPAIAPLLHSLVELLQRPSYRQRAHARAALELLLEQLPGIYEWPSPEFIAGAPAEKVAVDPLWRVATDLLRIRGILGDEPWYAELIRARDATPEVTATYAGERDAA